MADHREKGKLQTDKKPKLNPDGTLEPDKIVISLKEPAGRLCLRVYAWITDRDGLAEDLMWRIDAIEKEENQI